MNLKLISLIIAITGISLLLLLAFLLPPKSIFSYQDLKENSFVQTSGKVLSERNYSDFSIIKINNNITITCNCKGFFNKTIEVEGKVESYEGALQIKAYKIREK